MRTHYYIRCNKTAVSICSVLLLFGPLGWSAAFAQENEGGLLDTISGWLGSSSPVVGEAEHRSATPSHVFQAVQNLNSEIVILRDELGVYDYPPEAELHEDRAPVHVYAKTLELLDKAIHVQGRFGVPPGRPGQIPFKEIVPGDVLANVLYITDELRKIKSQMVIEREIEPAALVGGKTPSLVYKALADVSFLMDGLRGQPLTPSDVYQNCQHIFDEMDLVAVKLRVTLNVDVPQVEGTKRPKDVAQQVLRATYKVIKLQNRLGMDASGVPKLTMVRVTPSEVYDATNMILAEMARIKLHLDIDVPRDQREEARAKTPTDVFAFVLLIIENLDALSAGVRS